MIAGPMTLNEIKEQVIHLPPREQLQLVVFIGEHLSGLPITETASTETGMEPANRREGSDQLIEWAEAIAAQWQGQFDVSGEIRSMREKRIEQIWQSKS